MDIAFTVVSILSLLVFAKLGVTIRYRRLTQNQLEGVTRIQRLVALIGRVQQYRGTVMSSGSEHTRTLEISRQISQQRENLDDDLGIYKNDRWMGFLDHWSRLKNKSHVQNADPWRILQQFDAMANNLLQLLEELAHQDKLNKDVLADFPNINLLWRELPLIIENTHKLVLINELSVEATESENNNKKKIMLLKLILQLSRTCLHYVRYNGSPNPKKEMLLSLAAKYSQHLQHDLESGRLNQDKTSEVFQQVFSEHLKEFAQAFYRLQLWEMDMLKSQISAEHGSMSRYNAEA